MSYLSHFASRPWDPLSISSMWDSSTLGIPGEPEAPKGRSKATSEELMRMLNESFEKVVVPPRVFSTLGPTLEDQRQRLELGQEVPEAEREATVERAVSLGWTPDLRPSEEKSEPSW